MGFRSQGSSLLKINMFSFDKHNAQNGDPRPTGQQRFN